MTPDKARRLLDGTTPGPWEAYDPGDGTARLYGADNNRIIEHVTHGDTGSYMSQPNGVLAAHAPDMAAMIAGMREEWGVHVTGYPKNIADWAELCDSPEDHITWLPDEEAAADFAVEREDDGYTARIVIRYVTEPEATDAVD